MEVGDIKREIAYHGDPLNVTARIQKLCGVYKADLIITEDIKVLADTKKGYTYEFLEMAHLKGRKEPANIYRVERE